MKLLLSLQFGGAVGAAGDVLLQFMAGVIGQLAINLKHDIFSNPFTLHSCTFDCRGFAPHARDEAVKVWPRSPNIARTAYLISASAPRNFCVARKSVFLAVSSVVCKISPTVRNFNPW